MKKRYIYTLKSDLLEQAVNTYIDYITNPCHIYRQKHININMMSGEIIYNEGKGSLNATAQRLLGDGE